MWRAYKAMFTVRQKEEEDLRSYYEKFTNSQEVVENYMVLLEKRMICI